MSGGRFALLALLVAGLARADTMTFQEGVAPDPSYAGTRHVALINPAQAAGDRNYTNEHVVADATPLQKGALVQWDLSAIPSSATVTAARLVLQEDDVNSASFSFYEVLRPWSHAQATWLEAQAGVPWTAGGANGVGADRGGTALGTLTGAGGSTVIDLNAAGVAVVQKWVATPSTNHGLLLQNYASATNAFEFLNSADPTLSQRPLLRVTYNGGTQTSFQNGVAPTAAYAGSVDTTMVNAPPTGGNAAGFPLILGTLPAATVLLKFDLGALPANARVTAATFGYDMRDPVGVPATVHEALRPWTETGATWLTFDGASAWETAGAAGALDRGSALLATLDLTLGGHTVALDAPGVQLIDAWVHGTKPNHGFVITNSAVDGAMLRDRTDRTAASRPALTLTYVIELPDGGAATDGGVATDGGAATDGGIDGNEAQLELRRLAVGCGCGAAGGLLPLALALGALAYRRRSTPR